MDPMWEISILFLHHLSIYSRGCKETYVWGQWRNLPIWAEHLWTGQISLFWFHALLKSTRRWDQKVDREEIVENLGGFICKLKKQTKNHLLPSPIYNMQGTPFGLGCIKKYLTQSNCCSGSSIWMTPWHVRRHMASTLLLMCLLRWAPSFIPFSQLKAPVCTQSPEP